MPDDSARNRRRSRSRHGHRSDKHGRHRLTDSELEDLKLNKGWNEEIEYSMLMLKKKALVFKWLFQQGSIKLGRKGKIFGIVNVCASVASGSAIFANLPYDSDVVTIITGIVMYLLSVSIGLNEFLDYSNEADSYKDASLAFGKVAQMIDRQLIQDPYYRQEAKDFIIWIEREFNSVYENSPLLSPSLLAEFEKKFGSELNPDFMDARGINDPEDNGFADIAPDAPPARRQRAHRRYRSSDEDASASAITSASASGAASGSHSEASQSERETKKGQKTKRRERTGKRGTGFLSREQEPQIFNDTEANEQFAANYEDLRMRYELDRYYD